jgi:hypothetical protein
LPFQGIKLVKRSLALEEILQNLQASAEKMGVRNVRNLPELEEEKILKWMDEHKECKGMWPTPQSGVIPNSGGEKWSAVDAEAGRALPGLESQ